MNLKNYPIFCVSPRNFIAQIRYFHAKPRKSLPQKKISFYDKFFWADRFSSLPKKCNFTTFLLWRNLDDVEYVHQIRSYFALLQRQKWPQRWLRERDREARQYVIFLIVLTYEMNKMLLFFVHIRFSMNVSRNFLM